MPTADAFRTETDSLGRVEVPASRLWGAETERARLHFAIGRGDAVRWPREVVRAFGLVKGAMAHAHGASGMLTPDVASLIERAAGEVAEGQWDDEFPLGVFQTGSGTHSNMNANEVIANRANQLAGGAPGTYAPVHPHDHVNRGQSSNDVFPTVMHVSAIDVLASLAPEIARLRAALLVHADAWRDVPMLGRTHYQDATPIMAGEVVGAWIAHVDDAWHRVAAARDDLAAVALGATAVGSGLGADREVTARALARLSTECGVALRSAAHLPAALTAHDAMAATSAALRALAAALFALASDVRLYSAGPRAGIAELTLPAHEPGSSMMPGKVNPTQCEAMTMVALHVFGADATVAWANAQGAFQLNVYKPLILHHVLASAGLLRDACRSFTTYGVAGLSLDRDRVARHVAESLMLGTVLVPFIGYDRAAAITRAAAEAGITLREAATAADITPAQFDAWVDVARMARPPRP
jgi:fumarate hydratase class II